jgi:hypothetical protein
LLVPERVLEYGTSPVQMFEGFVRVLYGGLLTSLGRKSLGFEPEDTAELEEMEE